MGTDNADKSLSQTEHTPLAPLRGMNPLKAMWARATKMFAGLVVCGLLCALLLGPTAQQHCWAAVPLVAFLFFVRHYEVQDLAIAGALYTTVGIALVLAVYYGLTSPLDAPFQPLVQTGTNSSYALVTGASSGIGLEISLDLWARGWNLLLICRNTKGLKVTLMDRLEGLTDAGSSKSPSGDIMSFTGTSPGRKGTPGRIDLISVDLSKDDQLDQMLTTLHDNDYVSLIDFYVWNAGIAYSSKFNALPMDKLQQIVQLNVVANTKLARSVLPRLVERDTYAHNGKQRGRMLFVSSVTGCAPAPFQAVYSATKAYLTSLGEAIGHEVEPLGVGVTVSAPGATITGFGSASHTDDCFCFHVPFLPMQADVVAKEAVAATILGRSYVVHGWLNQVHVYIFAALFPTKLTMIITGLFWSPMSELGLGWLVK